MKILKGRKKADKLEISRPKEQCSGEFPGFPFLLHIFQTWN